jgi:hypothetical protein
MLKLGAVCCVAMLVLGIIGSGSEYRHKTIIPAMLAAPRRGTQVAAKVIAITLAGVLLGAAGRGVAVKLDRPWMGGTWDFSHILEPFTG